MSNTFRRLLRNLGSFILALLLAVAVWIAATLQSDPFTEREIPNVPITLLNQPADTVFIEPISERVTVTARAPEGVLVDLKVSDFEATMDLSGVQSGEPRLVNNVERDPLVLAEID